MTSSFTNNHSAKIENQSDHFEHLDYFTMIK